MYTKYIQIVRQMHIHVHNRPNTSLAIAAPPTPCNCSGPIGAQWLKSQDSCSHPVCEQHSLCSPSVRTCMSASNTS